MKFLIFLIYASHLSASMSMNWSNDFFGTVKQMEFVDVDGDGKKEIVAACDSGIFALDENRNVLWKNKDASGLYTLIPFQADNDDYLEFAVSSYLDVKVFDNDGVQLNWDIMRSYGSSKLPLALYNDKIVSHYSMNGSKGLKFIDEYSPFNSFMDVSGDALVSVDSNNNGVNDTLFAMVDANTTYRLNSNQEEVWKKEFSLEDSDSLEFLWAGKLNDGTMKELIGTANGYMMSLDANGNDLWNQKLDMGVRNIVKDKDGGFLVVSNYDYFMYPATQNILYKIDENDGSILWQHSSEEMVTKAITQDNHKIAAGFGSNVKVFNTTGAILQDVNISVPSSKDYLDIYSLKYGTLGSENGLFIGTMDISKMDDNDAVEKVFAGGDLLHRVASGDMDGDLKDEIIVQDDHRLYLYDGNGKLLWNKENFRLPHKDYYQNLEDVTFADLTGDSKDELIVIKDNNLSILNYSGNVVWSKNIDVNKIYLYDYNNDGAQDIFVVYDIANQQTIEVFDGKDGELLHEYGALVGYCSYLKVLNVDGIEKLYYSDSSDVYWIEKEKTFIDSVSSQIDLGSNTNYEDITGDGVLDLITYSYDINVYDLTKDTSGLTSLVKTIPITQTEQLKDLKLYDRSNDGTFELLAIFPSKIGLYDLDGNSVWEYAVGGDRGLFNVEIAKVSTGDKLFVSGYEVYVLDKNGNKLQDINPTNYMSTSDYYLPITLAKTSSNEMQLIVGSMGLYSYGSMKTENLNKSDFIPAILYLLF